MDALTRATRRARLVAGGIGPQRNQRRNERGDVPGWVLITLMTAGLVTALWAVARAELVDIFHRALSSVTG